MHLVSAADKGGGITCARLAFNGTRAGCNDHLPPLACNVGQMNLNTGTKNWSSEVVPGR